MSSSLSGAIFVDNFAIHSSISHRDSSHKSFLGKSRSYGSSHGYVATSWDGVMAQCYVTLYLDTWKLTQSNERRLQSTSLRQSKLESGTLFMHMPQKRNRKVKASWFFLANLWYPWRCNSHNSEIWPICDTPFQTTIFFGSNWTSQFQYACNIDADDHVIIQHSMQQLQ